MRICNVHANGVEEREHVGKFVRYILPPNSLSNKSRITAGSVAKGIALLTVKLKTRRVRNLMQNCELLLGRREKPEKSYRKKMNHVL